MTLPSEVALNRITQKTADSYAANVRLHLIPDITAVEYTKLTLAHIPLTKLSTRHIRTFLTAKGKETSSRGTPHSERSIQYLHAILRRALGDALARRRVRPGAQRGGTGQGGQAGWPGGATPHQSEARQVLAVIAGDRWGRCG